MEEEKSTTKQPQKNNKKNAKDKKEVEELVIQFSTF